MSESFTAARAAKDNLYIRKLKKLPDGMFALAVQKLTAGESAASVGPLDC